MDVVFSLIARQAPPPSGPVPAGPPPPGVKSNFINGESRQPQLIAAITISLVFATIFLVMRLWTRIFVTRSVGWDDYTAIVAMAFIAAHGAGSLHMLNYGLGKHVWDVTKAQYRRPSYLMWNVINYMLYMAAMGTVKISILLLYLRLFKRSNITKYSTYACLVFVGCYIVAGELSLIFGCQPLKKIFLQEMKGKCVSFRHHLLTQNSLNIVSDAMLILIPIPAAWALQLPKRQKIAIIAIFATASVACVASGFRLYYIVNPKRGDGTWQQFDGTLWSDIELNLALICSCMPAFKPFLQHYAPWLREISSKVLSTRSKSTPNASDKSGNTGSNYSNKSKGSDKEEFIELKDDSGFHPDVENHPRLMVKTEFKVVSESRERIVQP